MQIELVLKDVRLGRYARERVEHKLLKVTEKFHREVPIRVVVEDHKGTYRARVTSAISHRELVGQHESRSVLEALDEAILKFDRQLARITDKQSRKMRGQRAKGVGLDFAGFEGSVSEGSDTGGDDSHGSGANGQDLLLDGMPADMELNGDGGSYESGDLAFDDASPRV